MNNIDLIFHIWELLYDKNQNPKYVIEKFFHEDYTQSINGVVMNRSEYVNHVIEQRKSIVSMIFECKKYMAELDKLFILYNAQGKNLQGYAISAEIIGYFEFKDKKVSKIHGQVHLSQGNPSDVDMSQEDF